MLAIKKRKIKKIIATMLSMVMLVGVFSQYGTGISADTISDLEKKLAANTEKIKNTKSELAKTKDQKGKEEQYQKNLIRADCIAHR